MIKLFLLSFRFKRTCRLFSFKFKLKEPLFSILFLAFFLCVPGCGTKKDAAKKKPVPAFEIGRPNLVILVIDTLRKDHVGVYQKVSRSKKNLSPTPNIDKLASNGVVFSRAYSNAPWTFPSHASLFTGQEPLVHGQTHSAVYDKSDGPAVKKEAFLPGRFVTLAEALRQNNYQTIGISQNPWVGRLSTQNYGFDHFWELWSKTQKFPFAPRKGKEFTLHKATHAFRYFIKKMRDKKKPFFLFVNYITCHLPYTPDWKYRNKYVQGFPPDDLFDLNSHNWLKRKLDGKLDANRIDYLRKLYLGVVEEADAAVGQIINLLKEEGEFDNTLLIVTSDHGECIGHHGFFDHQFNIFDDLVSIPLVMHHPKLPRGKTLSFPVQLSDLFPTVLQLFGMGKLRDKLGLPGMVIPLDPAYKGDTFGNRPLFFLYKKGARVLRLLKDKLPPAIYNKYNCDLCGVQINNWKLILTGNAGIMLFNTKTDPGEKENLAGKNKEKQKELLSVLKEHFKPLKFPFSSFK